MAMNLEAVLRIAAKVVGLENITALEKGIQGAEKAASEAKGAFKAVVGSSAWQAAAAAATGFTVAMGFSVRAAMDLEQAVSGVRKVVDGLENPQGIAQLKNELMGLSAQFPISARGFAEIYAAAGASGVARENLREFAVVVAGVATAFQMTAQEAGQSIAQIAVSIGLTTPQMQELAEMMNYLDSNTGASAKTLVEFMTRAGATGKIAGLSAEQTAAFGAAMIQGGYQAEVAATSFNNMIKALSKGPSMTDRQVSALGRLGYAVVDAAALEKKWTTEAQLESDKRMQVYRNETDAFLKEIARRYRNQGQALDDALEDESKAYERSLQRRADARIDAIQKDQTISESSKKAAIQGIQDQLDAELTAFRRAQRDKQQVIQDGLEDRQEQERKAVEQRFKEQEAQEKARLEKEKAAMKAKAEALANEFKQSFADRMQKDAIGTITEVLQKIAGLPEAAQISVISDLFGDEARALMPLIGNIKELDRVIGLTGDKSKAAAMFLKELAIQKGSLQGQTQMLMNRFENLASAIGESFLPVLRLVVPFLSKLLNDITYLIKTTPALGIAIGVIGGALSAIVLAAPFILSLVTLLGQMGVTLAGIGKIAAVVGGAIKFALVSGLIPALQGVLAWIGSTLIPALLAFFSGPVGWTVLAVAAVVAMAIAFREPLMKFVAWLWEWGEPIREFWAGLWNGLVEFIGYSLETVRGLIVEGAQRWWDGVRGVWEAIGKGFTTYVIEPITKAWTSFKDWIGSAFENIGNIAQATWQGIVNGLKSVFRGVLQFIADRINVIGGLINRLIDGYNSLPNFGDIPRIPTLTVPAFAQGGLVSRPTLAMVGEGGEREYIVPESKMATASSRFLAGSRGADVIPSSSAATSGSRAPVINITTGPVLEFDGQRYVRMEDLEKAMRVTADGVIGRLRTPAARIALGRA